MALRWQDVDLAGGVIRVERGWDDKEGAILPKTKIAQRRVPVPVVLRDYLVEHRQAAGDVEDDWLVFGRGPHTPPFSERDHQAGPQGVGERRADRITLHECRHTFAPL